MHACRIAVAASLSMLIFTGCGSVPHSTSSVAHPAGSNGKLFGGEQPITGATIYLFEVNTATNGGASTNLLTTIVTTSDGTGSVNANANAGNDENQLPAGFFTITGDYTCPVSNPLVYLASFGGDPGIGTDNSAQEQVVALGPCNSVPSMPFIYLNEVTTVGTVAALHDFMSAYDHVGSTPANASALSTAFTTAAEYIDSADGTAPGPSLPAGYEASSNDLRALANAVQYCVDSNGATDNGSPCGDFFDAAQGAAASTPQDTVTALLDIFADPTNDVGTIFDLQGTTPAFAPTNSSAPPDWTLPILMVPSTPSISPNGGSYTSGQSVTITDTDTDATNAIYYTLDGSTPSADSTRYTGPITVSSSATINAIDIDDSRETSGVASAGFTITALSAPTVSLSSLSSTYGATAGVTITASGNDDGSVVTFGTAGSIGGSFSPATCTIASGSCSVSYVPSGTLTAGTYTNDLTASFSAAGSYSTGSATSTLTITTAYTFNLLDSFTGTAGAAPGSDPGLGELIQGSDGNFYGMAEQGGAHGDGSIFKVSSTGTDTLLYSFSGTGDGANPSGSLVEGSDGNFYGMTGNGGAHNFGSIFKITPGGAFTLLHSFAGTSDGDIPSGSLIQGSDGNFYGMASNGGANNRGTVFRIAPDGTFTLLYTFSDSGVSDANNPSGSLVEGSDGNFYGMARYGGANGSGSIFRISSTGAFTLLYSFSSSDTSEANNPFGSLVEGSDGNFYGMAYGGGANGDGSIFEITPGGTFTLLHSFAGTSDGANPFGSLVEGSDGNFYGMAYGGGANGDGSIFEIAPSGTFTLLHSFAGAGDGANPFGGLVQGADGNFYGMASAGGADSAGTIFSLTASPALPAPVTLTAPSSSVTAGSAFTLGYVVSNAYSTTLETCTATNTAGDTVWLGSITGSPTVQNINLTAPSTAGTYTYTLTCGGQESGFATLHVQ